MDEHAPDLRALAGAEPIEFLIELVARVKDEVRVLEDHRLRGIVGSPVRLAFEHAAQRPLAAAAVAPAGAGADAPSAPADGNLALEIMPLSLRDGRLHLKALIRSSGLRKDAPGDMTASSGEDVLPPGYALELPLPPVPGVPPLAVHVTAFF